MESQSKSPVTLKVEIDPGALKQLTEEGRLSDFVSAFPSLVAGHLKAKIVEGLARGGEVSFQTGFFIDDDDFGTGPQPFPFIDTVPLPESKWGLRKILEEVISRRK